MAAAGPSLTLRAFVAIAGPLDLLTGLWRGSSPYPRIRSPEP